jgi:hypothetical protein
MIPLRPRLLPVDLPDAARTITIACLLVLSATHTFALETDQYYTWGRELADSTDVVNAKFELEMRRAIASFDEPPEECIDIAIRFRKKMRFVLFHHIQMWAMNTSLVARIPADADEDVVFRRTNMYQVHGLFDPGMWMTFTPTIKVNEIRIGTDKLAHFVSSGWTYYTSYNSALRKGKTPEEAAYSAVRRGVLEESLILGKAASGVLSLGDLEANLQGMYFYLGLCGGDDPQLVLEDGSWKLARAIDLRDYVHPGWDESYRNPIFSKGRWRKVKQSLPQYCDRRSHPQVVEMHRRYRATERQTVAQQVVAELVEAGKLADPEQYSLDAVCPPIEEDPVALGLDDSETSRASATASPSREELIERVIEHEQDTERRNIRIAALRLSYPQLVSGSFGWLFTRQPKDYDCRTPCDLWGTFTQIEPGVGGGKLSLGWGRVIGEHRRGPVALSSVYLAWGLKGTVFRSWGSESRVPRDQTYAGAEFEFSIARVNAGVGALHRVNGDQGKDWIVTGHLGWGF